MEVTIMELKVFQQLLREIPMILHQKKVKGTEEQIEKAVENAIFSVPRSVDKNEPVILRLYDPIKGRF
jgi:hypothetical protein